MKIFILKLCGHGFMVSFELGGVLPRCQVQNLLQGLILQPVLDELHVGRLESVLSEDWDLVDLRANLLPLAIELRLVVPKPPRPSHRPLLHRPIFWNLLFFIVGDLFGRKDAPAAANAMSLTPSSLCIRAITL